MNNDDNNHRNMDNQGDNHRNMDNQEDNQDNEPRVIQIPDEEEITNVRQFWLPRHDRIILYDEEDNEIILENGIIDEIDDDDGRTFISHYERDNESVDTRTSGERQYDEQRFDFLWEEQNTSDRRLWHINRPICDPWNMFQRQHQEQQPQASTPSWGQRQAPDRNTSRYWSNWSTATNQNVAASPSKTNDNEEADSDGEDGQMTAPKEHKAKDDDEDDDRKPAARTT